jgi:hypothetical protein
MRSVMGVRRITTGVLSGSERGSSVVDLLEWTCSGEDVDRSRVDEVCAGWRGMAAVEEETGRKGKGV